MSKINVKELNGLKKGEESRVNEKTHNNIINELFKDLERIKDLCNTNIELIDKAGVC
ncbi:hypothetical protein B0P06_002206 [Clostridium saccharoperbutylacetonicum]|uniref:Uncharacterized protein n=1 Tax=Clostridium saccharoperbutylacetonicum N1-4(HMT) TaxID=931276 RepID=M1M1G9_9CLOT|nr:hypothetical protein [Clostridium saccharoperbutylacetonicum]AGF59455.1 hypothetical protein Cspa_c57300 [Clostridium saccharoperbutylacetonicum N1-4(HMT)]NRT59752.1 hypothetical protein [Clostridium saccharoperbutylacetonicum]NSB23064.1 hypothetical protein [Clostridium saccharoperbutylacetonicum]NSB42435.1 hypothetical protein [Clostridium saccharoperbutylacetonicum]